jgi:hypothetical protein
MTAIIFNKSSLGRSSRAGKNRTNCCLKLPRVFGARSSPDSSPRGRNERERARSRESVTLLVKVLDFSLSAEHRSLTRWRRLSDQFFKPILHTQMILNRIPKRTCRLRVQQFPINKLGDMHITI